MRRMARTVAGAWLACGLLLTVGCTDPKDARIAELEQRNAQLEEDLASAQMTGDAASRDHEAARQRLLGLEKELADARAKAESGQLSGDWEAVPGGAKIAIAGNLLFDSGKNVLRSDAKRRLDKVASDIRERYADKDIAVFGHTDSEPIRKSGWDDNYELSCQRALAVVRYLKSKGIAGERLIACGCGEFRPQAANTSVNGKARNRRVEIFAVNKYVPESRLAAD